MLTDKKSFITSYPSEAEFKGYFTVPQAMTVTEVSCHLKGFFPNISASLIKCRSTDFTITGSLRRQIIRKYVMSTTNT